MKITAAIILEDRGRIIPFCRTRRSSIMRAVAKAALEDVKLAALIAEPLRKALLDQEYTRLEEGLDSLGIGVESAA